MRRKVLTWALAALFGVAALGFVAGKPNFSGIWVLDKNQSFSNPPGLDQTLVVAHRGGQMKMEAKIKTPQGERVVNEEYTLDGKEVDFTPQGQGGQSGKGKRTASWLPDGRGILVRDVATFDSPNGQVTQETTRKWTLSADGRTLTIDYFHDTPRGQFESKRVFTKQ